MQPNQLSAESVRTQLRKILSSSTFARSERLVRFLNFTVEQTLGGHGQNLKEFVIGVEVFDKDEKYDPRMDPIVRVEARRLREKLRSREGRKCYQRRQAVVEPVIGILKEQRGMRRFRRRGLETVNTEWLMAVIAYNLGRLRRQ